MHNKKILLYSVPNLSKVSGGPSTRIYNFKNVFEEKNNFVIEGKRKLFKCLNAPNLDLTYVESATNRISFIDFVCLIVLRIRSKKIIVFVRDIYYELFPNQYKNLKGKMSKSANKLSNYFLTFISDALVFPTNNMGKKFFELNAYPKREIYELPPGTTGDIQLKSLPDFERKLGILYLGSMSYRNAGFNHFLEFARLFNEDYNFFVLSGDENANKILKDNDYIIFDKIPRSDIPSYIRENNISFAFHSRPRNEYDDLTLPIKVLDFLSMNLPFITESHVPIVKLLGSQYPLFCNVSCYEEIDKLIRKLSCKEVYEEVVEELRNKSAANTYYKRYEYLLSIL